MSWGIETGAAAAIFARTSEVESQPSLGQVDLVKSEYLSPLLLRLSPSSVALPSSGSATPVRRTSSSMSKRGQGLSSRGG